MPSKLLSTLTYPIVVYNNALLLFFNFKSLRRFVTRFVGDHQHGDRRPLLPANLESDKLRSAGNFIERHEVTIRRQIPTVTELLAIDL